MIKIWMASRPIFGRFWPQLGGSGGSDELGFATVFDLGAILELGAHFLTKKWLWLENRAFLLKKMAVARELGMGDHLSRATATFVCEKCAKPSPQQHIW